MTPNNDAEHEVNAEAALYQARADIIREMPEIIKEIIEKAKEGSYLHAKFLLEFAESGPGPQSGEDDGSLAKMLLKELHEKTTCDDAAAGEGPG